MMQRVSFLGRALLAGSLGLSGLVAPLLVVSLGSAGWPCSWGSADYPLEQ